MDAYVARQPILDRKQRVAAYELLFRTGPQNAFPVGVDGSHASTRVIHDALNVFGIETLAAEHQVFINVTRDVLIRELIRVLPPQLAAVEILESVQPDREVLAACRALKSAGYKIVLDDFVFRPGYEPLVALADIVKVDFVATQGAARREIVERFARPGVSFLAEKVETQDDFAEAVALGYELFQGYFFCRPQIVAGRNIPGFKLSYLRLLQLVNAPVFDLQKIETIIKQEVSLSVKLLRYLNSAVFGWYQRVTSIKQALVLLGEAPFRKWVALIALTELGTDQPGELVVTSLVRARFCELVGARGAFAAREIDVFLLGMLSLVDALIGRPMTEVLEHLAVAGEVRDALLFGRGPLADVYSLVLYYERGEWAEAAAAASALGLGEGVVPLAYRDAVAWVNQIFAAEAP